MAIHYLQTQFCLLVSIVHMRDFKNILICAQIPRLHTDIFMCVCVCTIPAFRSVRFPLCRYTRPILYLSFANIFMFHFEMENFTLEV